jgi:hypothetical protein
MKKALFISIAMTACINASELPKARSPQAQEAIKEMPQAMRDECDKKNSVICQAILNLLAEIQEGREILKTVHNELHPIHDKLSHRRADGAIKMAAESIEKYGFDICSKSQCDPLAKVDCRKQMREYSSRLQEGDSWFSSLSLWRLFTPQPQLPKFFQESYPSGHLTMAADAREKEAKQAGELPADIALYKIKAWKACESNPVIAGEDAQACINRVWEMARQEHERAKQAQQSNQNK